MPGGSSTSDNSGGAGSGPGPLGKLAGRSGLWSLLFAVLGLWLAEAAHYTVLAAQLHGVSGLRALLLYAQVAALGAPLAVARWLFYMGGLWLFAWLLGVRGLDGRRALVAASYTALAHALAALAATPLWLVAGQEWARQVVAASYYGSLAAAAAALIWAGGRAAGGYGPRIALASIASVLLVGMPPAALLTPGFNAYASILYLVSGGGAGAAVNATAASTTPGG
ncbi:hypothetical protein [Pyrodictium abyssi]|uniref:Integral membrane protein n=1 Tax=Pyrodictium abyssi TaxID=54256 RepID=A0ABN6ZL22_9CREN|nr:hypothetical protein PABY_05220 [Pyrodictium abyssi]